MKKALAETVLDPRLALAIFFPNPRAMGRICIPHLNRAGKFYTISKPSEFRVKIYQEKSRGEPTRKAKKQPVFKGGP
jgi:hypothetical protein